MLRQLKSKAGKPLVIRFFKLMHLLDLASELVINTASMQIVFHELKVVQKKAKK